MKVLTIRFIKQESRLTTQYIMQGIHFYRYIIIPFHELFFIYVSLLFVFNVKSNPPFT